MCHRGKKGKAPNIKDFMPRWEQEGGEPIEHPKRTAKEWKNLLGGILHEAGNEVIEKNGDT